MTGAPYLRDLDDVRRNPTLDDLATFHKLSHMLPAIHSSAHHIVEPMDHAVAHRHLRITYSSMKYSDKTFMGMTTSVKMVMMSWTCAKSCLERIFSRIIR